MASKPSERLIEMAARRNREHVAGGRAVLKTAALEKAGFGDERFDGLRDRAALGALLWPTGDADAQGYEAIEARATSAYEHGPGAPTMTAPGFHSSQPVGKWPLSQHTFHQQHGSL
jgi:hypothetical protein